MTGVKRLPCIASASAQEVTTPEAGWQWLSEGKSFIEADDEYLHELERKEKKVPNRIHTQTGC